MRARTLFSTLLLSASALSFAQVIISGSGYGNVTPFTYLGAVSTVVPGKGVLLSLPNNQALLRINLPTGSNWTGYTHLQADVQNMGPRPEPFFFAIASTGIWCYSEVILSPYSDNTIIIPLQNAPNNGNVLPPHPSDNPGAQVFAGSSVTLNAVQWLMIEAPDQSAGTSLLIHDLRPVTATTPTTGIVDQYGQQAQITWPGKVNADADLVNALNGHTLSGAYPYNADAYGGVVGTAQSGSATGYWHTAKQNNKWYIIDPLGNRFFSAGVLNAGNGTPAMVTNHLSAFVSGALPSQTGPYALHYSTGYDPNANPILCYNFYTSNIQHRVGSLWQDTLISETTSRMRSWGFNTGGPATNLLLERASAQMPFMEIVPITGSYARIYDPSTGTSLPDIYDTTWINQIENSLQPMVQQVINNPYSIGLFVDNELPWAKPYSATNARYGMCEDIFASPSTQPAKIAFVQWIQQRYNNNVAAFNSAWGLNISSFADIQYNTVTIPQNIPTAMATDMQAWILQYDQSYLRAIRQKLTLLGYHGMYLGPRLRFYSPEMLTALQQYCDLISVNDYEVLPTYHHDDVKALDFPVMISEVGFGACDQGRVPTYPNLVSETDRASFWKRYMGDAMTWPNLVGVHWYKWENDVISGRFFDGYNECQGLVSITDIPYWDTVSAATTANTAFHNRLLTP